MNIVSLYASLASILGELSKESNRIMVNGKNGDRSQVVSITLDFETDTVSIAVKDCE